MKVSPYVVIGASSVLSIIALSLYFYETSPDVTDVPPTPVVVETETPPKVEETQPQQEDPIQEAEIAMDGGEMGINLARVRPDGSAVIAGQAPAGSTVNLIEDGKIIGTTVASASGDWVIIPDELLSKGAHLLSVEIIGPDGTTTIGSMALAIEIPQNGDETPLVALVPYTEEATTGATVIQMPESLDETAQSGQQESVQTTAEANAIASGDAEKGAETTPPVAVVPNLTIRSIQAISSSEMSVSGEAEGGTQITLSVNDADATQATADENAMYVATMPIDPDAQVLRLKGTLVDENGAAIATVRLKLSRSQFDKGLGSNALVVVQRGDALWRIAYKTYGQGIRYVDIYRQNQNSIKDPDLIYPDQIFVVPNGG